MLIGDRNTVYANLYQSGGKWLINVHCRGMQFASFASKYTEGFDNESDAKTFAENKIREVRRQQGYDRPEVVAAREYQNRK